MDSIPDVKEALAARSKVANLDDLRNRGRKQVKVVRAEQVAELISEAVKGALKDPRVVSRTAAERMVGEARREQEQRIAELSAELERVKRERDEAQGGGNPAAAAAAAATAGITPETMVQLMQQFAALQSGGQLAAPAGTDLTSAIDKLSNTLNERLEKFGRKMGVSGAVETDPVNLEALFKNHDDIQLESNIDSIDVKQKKAGGIAANLEKLKKLKGGG